MGLTGQALLLCALVANFKPDAAQLTPEYFNIARGKRITATATCGYDLAVGQQTELFCKLATVPGKYGIQGLECDHCDSKLNSGGVKETKDHRIEYAIDDTERWWQSPPLSRGQQYNKINITIDLGRAFHVAYVVVKTANSPRPAMWILEKSVDNGLTFTPWYYFAPSRSDCIDYFKINPRIPLEKDDQVLCSSAYSEVPPFENGEMHISLVNGRPSAKKNQFSPKLQEWMRATNVRLHLLKVKTLYGEWLPLAREDSTVTRRFFYSIKDISIGGRCSCNGYADNCDFGRSPARTLTCNCQKNTCGPACDKCCPGYVQYKWKSGLEGGIGCEACNCFNHATGCYYNEMVDRANRSYNEAGELKGGGVCIRCQDNTFGGNCQHCKHKFYNPTGVPMTNKDACVPCNCDERFSTGQCYNGDGQCRCKSNYAGKKCDQCSPGYQGFPDCRSCQCNADGTIDKQCDAVGNQCPCKEKFSGPKCDRCASGYYRFPYCIKCNCDRQGSVSSQCDSRTGQCRCKPGRQGHICNRCDDGYFGYPSCQRCRCDGRGVTDGVCDKRTGACTCRAGYTGVSCTRCSQGYYGFPSCKECGCSGEGAVGSDCDAQGQCTCKPRYAGIHCDRCIIGYYGYPRCTACACDSQGSLSRYCDTQTGQCRCKDSFSGTFCNRCEPGFYGFPNCQGCSCNPAGVSLLHGRSLGDCSSSNTGQCECKILVKGQDCSECKPKSFNLQVANPRGCDQCLCNVAGVIGGIELCDQKSGQCLCKSRVTSKRCELCKDGYYGLKQSNAFGCAGCNCDIGGSYSQICGKFTGQCKCRPNVGGRACDKPITNHYHPTLYQILSEIEDGRTPENTPVRFKFDEKAFPGYSWRGYGAFSDVQPTVIVTVDAKWPENYHMVFHYALNDSEDATGEVVVRRANKREIVTQKSLVTFKPSVNGSEVSGQFALVAENGTATQFALRGGRYDIEFTTRSRKLLLDYVTIVPVFYPGPRGAKQQPQKLSEYVLKDIVTRPCEVNGRTKLDDLCVQYSYVSVNKVGFIKIKAEEGYAYSSATGERPTQVFTDRDVLKELDFSGLAFLDRKQNRVNVRDVKVPKSGKYVMVVQYFTTYPKTQILDTYLRRRGQRSFARFRIPSCKYTFGCRTVGLSFDGGVKVHDLKSDVSYLVTAIKGYEGHLAVDSFILIPYEEWSTDYIVPSKLCVTRMKVCTRTSYTMLENAVMVEAGDNGVPKNNINKPPNIFDPNAVLVYLEGETKFEKTALLQNPGDYAIVVHYYQPHYTTIHSETSVSSFGSESAKTSFKYCPHTSGCRTVIQKLDGSRMFNLRQKTVVDFKIPEDKKLWIDYIMFVPKDSYTPLLSNGAPIDRTNDFIEYCSKDNLHVTNDGLVFCAQSVFTLTTFYNNGTFPCACDLRGSREEKCAEFGGQCSCFENVIGRNCTRCKSGYFGFPNCRKCDCDYCDPDTGVCKCPPNTVGDDCSCVKGTFGFDLVLGCQRCTCDASGVRGGDLECDVTTGQCSCQSTRTGRRCDKCKPGYYGYPACQKCDCDPSGTTGCDVTGRCLCKSSVTGTRCDMCIVGYFHLTKDNPSGCLQCWCSGQSNLCITDNDPGATGVIPGTWLIKGAPSDATYDRYPHSVIATFPKDNPTQPLYWTQELGDQTNVYGRIMTFTLSYSSESPDVPLAVIESRGNVISYNQKSSSIVKSGETSVKIALSEKNWRNNDGSSLSRADFLQALVQLHSLQFLASDIGANGETTFNVPMITASASSQVEKCTCPDNTTGLSCQNCRSGYFKSGDSCVLCACNGHSSSCDPITGECENCQDDTTGPKCDKCISGYYGDPLSGGADACQPCPCPAGRNFATSCLQRADGSFSCTCKPGFTGERCDECADGYYGDPLTVGCQPCQCNGNIDLNATGNCDRETGVCQRCVNNTGGAHCEFCQDGYYGDGSLGICARCACNTCGSTSGICDRVTGTCSCHPGVVGDQCTSCQAGTWNFDSCNGCKPCDCSVRGSVINSRCDANTGKCQCKPRVTGLKCDRCIDGFFAFSKGCLACNCPAGKICDINNGKCCDPDDDSCTFCPPYHIRTATGCEYCGPCVERLFLRVDKMLGNYTSINGTGVASDESKKRLNNMQNDLSNLERDVTNYNVSIEDLKNQVDGDAKAEGIDVPDVGSGVVPTTPPPKKNLSRRVDELNGRAADVVRKTYKLLARAMDVKENATETKTDALDVEAKLGNLLRDSQEQICPRGWVFWSGSCYFVSENRLDHANALKFCQDMKSSLAIVNSARENSFISKMLVTSTAYVIDGVRDASRQNQFFTIDGKKLGYTDWGSREPNDLHGNEDCVEIKHGKWNDSPCSVARRFVCSSNLLNGTGSDVTSILIEARKILHTIQGRDYTELRKLVEKELGLALDALSASKIRVNETTYLYDEVLTLSPRFHGFNGILNEQMRKSEASRETSRVADVWNSLAKTYDAQPILEKAKAKKKIIEGRLTEAKEFVQQAKDILSRIKHQNVSGNTTDINRYLTWIDGRIANLTNENELLTKLVNSASDHANDVKNTSEFLRSLLRDPNKFAEKALQAIKAYEKIVSKVDEVLEIAQEADTNGGKALILSIGLGTNATAAKDASKLLDDDAIKTSQKIPVLEDWLRRLEDLIKKIRDNFQTADETLAEVRKPFPKFDVIHSKLGERIVKVEKKAKDAESDSKTAKDLVDNMKFPDIKVLEKGYEDAKKLLKLLEGKVDENEKTISQIKLGVDSVTRYQEELEEKMQTEVVDRINRIRFNIERGREKIRNFGGSAAQYGPNTLAELRIPEALFGPAMQTRIAFDFQPAQSDALLMFLGSQKEFISFGLRNWKLQVVVGNGDDQTTISQDKLTMEKGKWSHVEFVKTGSNVVLKVDKTEVIVSLPPSSSTFNIDRDSSVLFVGAPPIGFTMPSMDTSTTSFIGGFNKLYIDGRKVGLYDVKNYTVAPTGLRPRSPTNKEKVELDKRSNELSFNGNGYLYFKEFENLFKIQLKFITAADDGVILFSTFTNNLTAYFIIEMVKGTVGIRYDGISPGGPKSVYTKKVYNDAVEHKLFIKDWTTDVIKVEIDGMETISINDKYTEKALQRKKIYIGGIKRTLNFFDVITTPGFLGCIMSVKKEKENTVQKRNWDTMNVAFGCDVHQASHASFVGNNASIVMEEKSSSSETSIGFAFKSEQANGILWNFESSGGGFLTLGFEDGELKFQGEIDGESFGEDPGRRRRRRAGTKPVKLDDGKWHSIEVRFSNGLLEIIVDNVVVAKHKFNNTSTTLGKGKMMFGGVDGKSSKSPLAKRLPPLKGEIKDPILVTPDKAKAIDFGQATSKTGVTIGERVVPYFEKDVKFERVIVTPTPVTQQRTGVPTKDTPVPTEPPLTTVKLTDVPTTSPAPTDPPTTTPVPTDPPTTTRVPTDPPTTTPVPTDPPTTTPEPTDPPTTTPEPTDPPTTTPAPTDPPTTTPVPTDPPTTTPVPTDPPTTTPEPTKPPTTTPVPTDPPTTTPVPTDPPTTIPAPTDPPTTTPVPTEPPTTTPVPTDPPTTIPAPTDPPTTTPAPTDPSTTIPAPTTTSKPGSCNAPEIEYADTMAFHGNKGYAMYHVTEKGFERVGGLSFEFRTNTGNGILFYSADKKQSDFISCYLKDGKVYFAFNTGSGTLELHTNKVFNNGKWHKVTVYRNKVRANMTVDSELVKGMGKPWASVINGVKVLYFGGYYLTAKNVPKSSQTTISACIRRLKWHTGREFPLKPKKSFNMHKCYKSGLDNGVFFSSEGDYLIPDDKFSVGRSKDIIVEIKPRALTGLIFAAVDEDKPEKGDYLVLEMNNGSIVARVQNGDGVVMVIWKPPKGETLCDNQWHTIKLKKFGNSMAVVVDDKSPIVVRGKGSKNVANMNHPLYVGGLPKNVKSVGYDVRSSFVGCIRSMSVKSRQVVEILPLSRPVSMFGNVSMYGCPRTRKK